MAAQRQPTLDDAIRDLYRGPLSEFTPRRQALLKALQKQDPASAAAIKELRKPAPSAWAVNQLFLREAQAMASFSGAAGRALAAKSINPATVRYVLDTIRAETSRLAAVGAEILAAADLAASEQVAAKLRQNLEALALDPAHRALIARGWLDVDLDAPGFEVTAALQLAADDGRAASSNLSASTKAATAPPSGKGGAQKPSRASYEAAERAARERQQRIEKAQIALAAVEARATELRRAAEEAAETASRLTREAATAQQMAERSRFAASDAKRQADGAATEIQAAREAVRKAERNQ